MSNNILDLAKELITRRSITPDDAGCQQLLAEHLRPLGFITEHLRFGDVDNLWARRGEATPLVVFAGHTDVVPPGPLEHWQFDPFTPTVADGFLYGRGAADMKSSLAAFVVAIERFVSEYPQHHGSIALLITSDEEGPAKNGTTKVIDWLHETGQKIDYCIVGEPSADETVGDTIKHGRRGSLSATLRVRGIQGHVAYPHLASNPIHAALGALQQLADTQWDTGNEHFPATSFQITHVESDHGAENVIPGNLLVRLNFRFSTNHSAEYLQQQVEEVLQQHGVDYAIQWSLSGLPFLTKTGPLIDAVRSAVLDACNIEPILSTAGGTSDGRFIAPTGAQVVEVGPSNRTIHKVNECIAVSELDRLVAVYYQILKNLLT